jgi:glycosyltransferase involved in cell wall biosynthesis
MKDHFDIIIVSQLPSSYKVNLYNELSKLKKIYVIFISSNSIIRNGDFISKSCNFEYQILNITLEDRNKFSSICKLIKILSIIKSKFLIVNGWDFLEFWASLILFKGAKGVAIESSIFETNLSFLHKIFKRLFLFLTNFALPSGTPHVDILIKLNYTKPYSLVGGVGIPNLFYKRSNSIIDNLNTDQFLFIGRLVPEKNIEFLIKGFSEYPYFKLLIIGSGPLKQQLESIAGSNVTFIEHIDNQDLGYYYSNGCSFILPSVSEPWGLVVEEALQFRCPVIVSNKVGCSYDLVKKYGAGIVFDCIGNTSFKKALNVISIKENREKIKENISKIDFDKFYSNQVEAYSLNWLLI